MAFHLVPVLRQRVESGSERRLAVAGVRPDPIHGRHVRHIGGHDLRQGLLFAVLVHVELSQ
ncbi:hypothetical protein D3C78_1979850 [compost metagenome]